MLGKGGRGWGSAIYEEDNNNKEDGIHFGCSGS